MDSASVSKLTKAFIIDLISMGEEVDLCSALRPENVLINEDKIYLKETMPRAAFVPVAGFAAPEQYVQGDCARAPVYFMGALMMTLLKGAPPPDARTRTEADVLAVGEDPKLGEVVQKCLAYDPEKRYPNLSFVLDALQKADGEDESAQLAKGLEEAAPKKKYGKKIGILVLVVLVLAGGVLGYTLVQGQRADDALENADYAAVTRILDRTPWLKESRQNPYDYASAMQYWQSGNYDGALELLQGLAGYADSEEQMLKVQYDKGLALLQVRRLDEAKGVFDALGEYEDSATQSAQITAYLQAEEMTDPLLRYEAFSAFGEYLDSKAEAQKAAKEVYSIAMSAYEAGDIQGANSLFTALQNFQDAPIYKQVCELWLGASEDAEENREILASMLAYEGVANLEPVLMSDRLFMVFLEGDWTSADGGGDMYFGEDEFRAPLLPIVGQRWAFQNRSIGNEKGAVAVFGYTSPDEVTMTIAESGATYTYNRVEEAEAEPAEAAAEENTENNT